MQTRNMNSKQRSRCAVGINVTMLLALALLSIDAVAGRPDVRQSPFSLELQPPLLEAATDEAAFSGAKTIDSYGNPIDALRPIDTPDGRKVVSAQGVQFEIPNYASGITEIRKPADDLLPPHTDAIAVALPATDSESTVQSDSTSFAPAPATSLTPPNSHESSTSNTDVEVEQAELVPLQQQQQQETVQAPQLSRGILPEYLLEMQQEDPNIGGAVAWTPAANSAPLSVIAWDLLPPVELAPWSQTEEPLIITEQQPSKHVVGVLQPNSHNIRVSLNSGQALTPVPAAAVVTPGQVSVVPLSRDGPEAHGTNAHVGSSTTPRNAGRFPNRQRGTVHYSTTTTTERPRSTTTARTTTTTTTRATTPSTTRRSTTTTTTTPRPYTTTSTTTVRPVSTTPLDPSTFYKLENEENYAYTLPPWLQEVTDPDLDVAVTFIVPTDNDQYNHSLAEDLEPPFEPFLDLKNIQLTPPPTASTSTTSSTTTTTTTTTTTRRPSTAAPTTTTTTTTPAPTPAPTHAARTTQAPIYQTQSTTERVEQLPQQSELITQTIHTAPAQNFDANTKPSSTTVEPNPFDSATLPPWLQDFDYPDVGPGVPYNPDNFKESPAIQAPAGGGSSKPNEFQPQGFASRSQLTTRTTTARTTSSTTSTSTSAPAITASSAFSSQVTLTLPDHSGNELNTVEPPQVLLPPAATSDEAAEAAASSSNNQAPHSLSTFINSNSQHSTTNSITHFPARLDETVPAESAVSPAQPARTTHEEQFPPFNANDNQKFEFTKSDEGKVISTPVNTQRKDTQANSVFHSSALPPTSPTPASNTGRYTGGFGAPAGLLRPQTTSKPDIYVAGDAHDYNKNVNLHKLRPGVSSGANVNPGRYSGGFGAPGGVLNPQNAPRPFQQAQQSHLATAASSHHANRFGGPPGVLTPFDNVQRAAPQ